MKTLPLMWLLALLALFAVPARAQTPPPEVLVNNPAEHFMTAPGGVDMRTGRYVYDETDLSIGGEKQPSNLSLARTMTDITLGHLNPFGNFSSNWEMMVVVYNYDVNGDGSQDDLRATVHTGGRAETFISYAWSSGFWQMSAGASSLLTLTGGTRTAASTVYTYTAGDGTVTVFRPLGTAGGGDCSNSNIRWCAYASTITSPDGTVYTLGYAATGSTGNSARLKSVVSSRGYALLLEGSGSLTTKACVINLAQTAMPGNGLCPANALATTSYGYDGQQRLTSVTKPGGAVTTFGYAQIGPNGYQIKFYKPGNTTTPWLTNTFSLKMDEEAATAEITDAQVFADGRTYTYGYDVGPGMVPNAAIAGGRYRDSLNNWTEILYGFPILPGTGVNQGCPPFPCSPAMPDDGRIVYQQTSGPIAVVDPLGRTTRFDYCNQQALVTLPPSEHNRCIVEQLQSSTDPEGIKTEYKYSGRRIIEARRKAKPGTGLPDIVTTAVYGCVDQKCYAKPTSVTDPRGNTTTYVYKVENGEILTETKPADVNGIQPVTRYAYVQRRAWVSNGSGGYVQSATPVWLLSTEKTCRTTATSGDVCAGGAADEVVTSYDYGSDSGPNTLLLRGKVVTADGVSLRTCYEYDAMGNKISETTPRGTTSGGC